MSIHRSRFEIYKELLTQVHNGNCQPASLMHSTNISFGDLDLYKETLISLGLLMEVKEGADNGSRTRFHVTEKGESVLEYLESASNSVNLEEKIQT
jgi:predicted transcriptional regulator